MDTIVIASEMPCFLAFLDQDIAGVVELWDSWIDNGEVVRARHENPARDAVVRFRPAAMSTIEFIPTEQRNGRRMADRMLWSKPTLIARPDAADLPPEHAHYWTINMTGFSATRETLPNGSIGLVLGSWEPGRL